MEKRRFRRTDFETSGSFVGERGRVEFDLIDVSLKGALVNPADPDAMRIGDRGPLTIRLSGTTLVISADAECVHREHEYFGFRFAMMDLDSVTHLRRLIELNTPDDGDLERELGFLVQR